MHIDDIVKRTILRHNLIENGDTVLVGLSGGKDSMALLRLLATRSRIFNPRFSVVAAYVKMSNIAYHNDEERLQAYCDECGVKLHVVETSFDPSTDQRHTPCYLCSHYRRRALFQLAEKFGCRKLALGHHLDDVVHTALLNLIQQGSFSSITPRLDMQHYALSIIRPMYFLREQTIRSYVGDCVIPSTPCPYDTATQRTDVKKIAEQMEQLNPNFVQSVLHALGQSL